MTRSSAEALDDAAALERGDPAGMLRDIASGAAQVREAALLAAEAGVERLADEGRPRAVVVCGMGGSGIAGDVLAAVAGVAAPVPIMTHRGYGLPGWVGPMDLVVAVSSSGGTQETLSALGEAVRRGCRLMVVGAAGSPVDDLGQRGRAVFVPVTQGRQPRASIWALSTPLVAAGHALGLLSSGPQAWEETAAVLEGVAERCRIDAEQVVNPAKRLAVHLDGMVPVLWGTSPLAGTAAYRFACQLNENAQLAATWGVLPEASHNQVVAFDGPMAGGVERSAPADDLFRDRADDVERSPSLAVVLLRGGSEHAQTGLRADVLAALAEERGIPVLDVPADGEGPFARLASLIAIGDYASTYLALLRGTDPTPVKAITALKQRIAR